MEKVTCGTCRSIFYKSPSKINKRNYCSAECYSSVRAKELTLRGKKSRFAKGNKRPAEWTKTQKEKCSGTLHPAWKGSEVSYRGLHQWIRRKKGIPKKCRKCGKKRTDAKSVQWANIDGKYRRDIADYIELCVSCHKNHDLKMASSTPGSSSAIRSCS